MGSAMRETSEACARRGGEVLRLVPAHRKRWVRFLRTGLAWRGVSTSISKRNGN
jgi:hypothetical protein